MDARPAAEGRVRPAPRSRRRGQIRRVTVAPGHRRQRLDRLESLHQRLSLPSVRLIRPAYGSWIPARISRRRRPGGRDEAIDPLHRERSTARASRAGSELDTRLSGAPGNPCVRDEAHRRHERSEGDLSPNRAASRRPVCLHPRSAPHGRGPCDPLPAAIEGRALRVLRLCGRSPADGQGCPGAAGDRVLRRRSRIVFAFLRRSREQPACVGGGGSGRDRFLRARPHPGGRRASRHAPRVVVDATLEPGPRDGVLLRPANPRLRLAGSGDGRRRRAARLRQRRSRSFLLETRLAGDFGGGRRMGHRRDWRHRADPVHGGPLAPAHQGLRGDQGVSDPAETGRAPRSSPRSWSPSSSPMAWSGTGSAGCWPATGC